MAGRAFNRLGAVSVFDPGLWQRQGAGVVDVVDQGHGYAVGTVDRPNPFYAEGTELRGHEFHYSRVVGGADSERTVMGLAKGVGVHGRRDGVVKGNVWASYLHLHARTSDAWADGLVAAARRRAGRIPADETSQVRERER